MPRIKIKLPAHFSFETIIPVRITDINYGHHVGNDTILSILHEARVQYFDHFGYKELNFEGVGLIMSDAAIEFRDEIFYGEKIIASVTAEDFSKFCFEVYYKIEKEIGLKRIRAVVAKTEMVCYDYSMKKITAVPAKAKQALLGQ